MKMYDDMPFLEMFDENGDLKNFELFHQWAKKIFHRHLKFLEKNHVFDSGDSMMFKNKANFDKLFKAMDIKNALEKYRYELYNDINNYSPILAKMDDSYYIDDRWLCKDLKSEPLQANFVIFLIYAWIDRSKLDITYCFDKNGLTYVSSKFILMAIELTKCMMDNGEEMISKSDKSDFKTYLMYDENINMYKIGKAKDPCLREGTLQGKKPTITLFCFCNANLESKLHKEYASKRVRGEWFALSQKDVRDIKKMFYSHGLTIKKPFKKIN